MTTHGLIALIVLPSFIMGLCFAGFASKLIKKLNLAKIDAGLKAEQFEATVSASLDGIIIINADGNVVDFSDSAERIFGHKKSDIIGKNMCQIIVPERYRAAHDNGMARMRETGTANILGQRIEIEALKANGEEFMSELAISRSRSSNGDIFIAYIRDISKAKAAEQALLEAKDSAELANRAKTQFISAMSHEIRTPFNAVLGILDILGDTKLTLDQSQLVKTAERTSQSLLRIFNDVLDYARISSGSVKMVSEAFYVPEVFDDIKSLFAIQGRDRNITLSINKRAAQDIYLSGDIGRLRQVLINFVSNALKYTKNGTVELIVQTLPDGTGKWNLCCKVKDSGPGISKDQLEHLFDEFYMVDEVDTRGTEGAGLGLTICKVLSKMMGGRIGVESELGQGSTFWINIPLEQVDAPIKQTEIEESVADIKGKQILLAEDNATNRMVVSRILEKRGALITVATNGIEALECLDNAVFDLLLTDVFMPEMGGKELVQTLRDSNNQNANMPVIALTAMGDVHEAEELKRYGVDQVILKPFNTKDLIGAISNLCSTGRESFVEPVQPEFKVTQGLLDGLDPEDIVAIKGQFEKDLRNTTEDLRQAIAHHNIEATQMASHTLKGLSGVYGLNTLSKVAELTNSNCFEASIEQMVTHGAQAIKIADMTLLKINDLFKAHDEAA